MKALNGFLLFAACFISVAGNAQSDSALASQRALIFADSMVNAFRFNNLDVYTELSYAGVIKYYGGKKNFGEYLRRARAINESELQEQPEQIKLLQLVNDISEWQCVIQKTRETSIDGRKATIISYLVGQSKDDGRNWKFFDVAFNSVENVIYIMPDIFDTLAIPQRKVVYEKTGIAGKR
jgi:hypothetical protein